MAQIRMEPWQIGTLEGSVQPFNHSGYDDIIEIEVKHDKSVDYMRVRYMKGNHQEWRDIGFPDWNAGHKTDKVTLKPSEYLVGIEGKVLGNSETSPAISQLKLISNKKNIYGPFGTNEEGTPFVLRMKGAKIVGFHGMYHLLKPSISLRGINGKPHGAPPSAFHAYNPGPLGGGGGEPWDDGIFTRIDKVVVYVDKDGSVISMQTFYELDGSFYTIQHPAGKTGGTAYSVDLKENSDYLTRISGFFGPLEGHPDVVAVKALWFHTSRRKEGYGPFGRDTGLGEFFSSSREEGEIVGFHGRSGSEAHLYAIGAHIKYTNRT